MSKWTRSRPDPGRTYQDEDEAKQLRADMQRIKELVKEAANGNSEAEATFVRIINRLDRDMTKEKRKELLTQFADAVLDEQRQRNLLPR